MGQPVRVAPWKTILSTKPRSSSKGSNSNGIQKSILESCILMNVDNMDKDLKEVYDPICQEYYMCV